MPPLESSPFLWEDSGEGEKRTLTLNPLPEGEGKDGNGIGIPQSEIRVPPSSDSRENGCLDMKASLGFIENGFRVSLKSVGGNFFSSVCG
jgi:hypothetical protein